MPTPAARDVEEAHPFASTCPEDQPPHSPSSWHPAPPYPLSAHDPVLPGPHDDPLNADDDLTSRSATMSPGPESETTSDGPTSNVDAIMSSRETTEDAVDAPKRSDSDETMHDSEGDRPEVGASSAGALAERRRHTAASSSRRRRVFHTSSDKGYPARQDSVDSLQVDGVEEEEIELLTGYDMSSRRLIPSTPSSFLRSGSRFTGTQQSERQVYQVDVEIKHVDLRESFLCGYLRIEGLTEDHPTLTTYFEGEIIGNKYGFMTRHETWGANDRIDLSHWGKFAAFKPLASKARKGNVAIKDFAQREHIFMRWKEHFLVPDHRVRTINGASFEGFYYICFNQIQGLVSGIYFHSKSEKFQQLELKHVEDKGCLGSMEFR